MKRFIQSEDRTQATLLPELLDDYVAETNPVRVVDVFVDGLDLRINWRNFPVFSVLPIKMLMYYAKLSQQVVLNLPQSACDIPCCQTQYTQRKQRMK